MDNKKVLVAVGIGAVILAIVFIIALVPDEPVVDPYVVELESEVANYTAQIDSMDNVVLGMNDRINAIRTQMDSSRASNKVLLGSLRKVTNEMKEYRRLYGEQKRANERLVNELKQVRAERDPIDRLRKRLVIDGVAETDLKSVDREVKEIIADAAEFAQASPEPDPSELFTDILAEA